MLGALASLIGLRRTPGPSIDPTPSPELPKMNRVGGGHRGSKAPSDATYRTRARKLWEKKRRRNSRRGIYTVRGCRV